MGRHFEQVLQELATESELALKRAKLILQQSREGTLPKMKTVVDGNHMMIYYEDEQSAVDLQRASQLEAANA